MTVILPPPTSVGNEVGRAAGQGIAQGGEIAFNRGLLQKGLESLKNLPAEATPFELATSLINATAGIPGAERYVAQLFPELLKSQQARQKANEDAIRQSTQGRGLEGQQIAQPPSLEELRADLGEKFFPNIQKQEPVKPGESLKPQKALVPPVPIGPAEVARIRKNLANQGITDLSAQDDIVDQIKRYQNEYYAAQKEGFNNLESYQNAKKQRDVEFFKNSESPLAQAHGTMTPSEKAIWSELSRQYEDLPDPQRFSNTEQLYNNLVGGPLIEFENSQQGLPIGSKIRPDEVTHRLSDARTSIQDHLKRIEDRDLPKDLKGIIKNELRDQYFRSMGEKDFGVAQAAYATSNLSPETAKVVPMAPPPLKTSYGLEYLAGKQMREKYTYDLSNSLAKIKPDDSLILLREKALANNYDDKSFNEALNLAINNGMLELSDYQAKERNKLSIPQRLDLDTIMSGKRSVWDLFKGKQ